MKERVVTPIEGLLWSWLGCGVLATGFGFSGQLTEWLAVVLLLPLTVLGYFAILIGIKWYQWWRDRQWLPALLLSGLIGIWIVHFTGVFVPETGFDAVWYHLPIAHQFVEHHRILFLPDFYQSVNPLFSDLIFILGYAWAAELGTKIVAFSLAVSLIITCFALARRHMTTPWALALLIQLSLIQPVAWQASSFYVDVAKAFWEVGALYVLWSAPKKPITPTQILLSALLFGAALATKQFSLLLVPILLINVWSRARQVKLVALWLGVTLIIPLPFYFFSWLMTSNPWYAIQLHVDKIGEIGRGNSLVSHLWTQLIHLPYSGWYLIIEAHDYVSPLAVLLLPFAWKLRKELVAHWPYLIFAIGQYALWWFIPPVSTRYALSGFIIGFLWLWIAFAKWTEVHPQWKWPALGGILLISGFLLLPRLYVARRNLIYLIGGQSKTEYLQQFLDGNIDQPLKRWHQLE